VLWALLMFERFLEGSGRTASKHAPFVAAAAAFSA
jgi:hypothetical protein